MEYRIDEMTVEDWERLRSIFLQGIATGHATLESDAPDREKWDSAHLSSPRWVVREGEAIFGTHVGEAQHAG